MMCCRGWLLPTAVDLGRLRFWSRPVGRRETNAMSGVILALPDRPTLAAWVLSAAGRLAELAGAPRINVLVIRTPPEATILPSEEVLTRMQERRVRAQEQVRIESLHAIFHDWVRAAGPAGIAEDWNDIEGSAEDLVDEWGRRADFIVMRRPADHEREPERQALHAALFASERPVLLVPPHSAGPFGCRVAVAWRGDERTVKAVLSALRVIGRAEQIHVLAGTRDPAAALRLPEIFEEHGIAATLHVLPITGQHAFGAALLDAAHAFGADMMVMGAFARHPVRSMILGGVTRYMLAHADLPVLMRH
jgi:nucleotide-binding universal stress UspA family protein